MLIVSFFQYIIYKLDRSGKAIEQYEKECYDDIRSTLVTKRGDLPLSEFGQSTDKSYPGDEDARKKFHGAKQRRKAELSERTWSAILTIEPESESCCFLQLKQVNFGLKSFHVKSWES